MTDKPDETGLDTVSSNKTVTRYVGMCQYCGNTHKLSASGTMVHHGFTRPGDGAIHGDCPAVYERPYEVSCDFTKTSLGRVEDHLASAERHKDSLPDPDKVEGDWNVRQNARLALYKAEKLVRLWQDEAKRLKSMVVNWEVRPIRTVEEAEAPKVAERTAAKAARDAERAAKMAAKVAKYSARLAQAVEKKNPKIIAEIYDSAPRQLEGLGNAAEVYRSIPGAVEIFRLFGLSCQGRDPADDKIQFAMRCGLYHPEKNVYGYIWP